MRRVSVVIALLALMTFGTVASASALSSIIPYINNGWTDRSHEGVLFVDRDDQGNILGLTPSTEAKIPVVGIGDIFLGMWEVESYQYNTPNGSFSGGDPAWPGEAYTATFGLAVSSAQFVTDGGITNLEITYRALSEAEWDAVIASGYAAAAMKPTGNFGDGITVLGAMAKVYSDPTEASDKSGEWTNPDVDGDIPPGPATGPADWPADFATASNNATLLWEIGFNGSDNESWTATLFNTVEPDKVEFEANLSVLEYYNGAPWLLLHDQFLRGGSDVYGPYAQVQLSGGISENALFGDGLFLDNTNIWIHPTPEPGTLALLGLGLVGLGGVVYRRRRQK